MELESSSSTQHCEHIP